MIDSAGFSNADGFGGYVTKEQFDRTFPKAEPKSVAAQVKPSIECLDEAERRIKELRAGTNNPLIGAELGAIAELIRDARGPLTVL